MLLKVCQLTFLQGSRDADSIQLASIVNVFLRLQANDGIDDPGPLQLNLFARKTLASRLQLLQEIAEQGKGTNEITAATFSDDGENESQEFPSAEMLSNAQTKQPPPDLGPSNAFVEEANVSTEIGDHPNDRATPDPDDRADAAELDLDFDSPLKPSAPVGEHTSSLETENLVSRNEDLDTQPLDEESYGMSSHHLPGNGRDETENEDPALLASENLENEDKPNGIPAAIENPGTEPSESWNAGEQGASADPNELEWHQNVPAEDHLFEQTDGATEPLIDVHLVEPDDSLLAEKLIEDETFLTDLDHNEARVSAHEDVPVDAGDGNIETLPAESSVSVLGLDGGIEKRTSRKRSFTPENDQADSSGPSSCMSSFLSYGSC